MTKEEYEALPALLTQADARRALEYAGLKVGRDLLYSLVEQKRLRGAMVGRRLVIGKAEVERFVQGLAEPESGP